MHTLSQARGKLGLLHISAFLAAKIADIIKDATVRESRFQKPETQVTWLTLLCSRSQHTACEMPLKGWLHLTRMAHDHIQNQSVALLDGSCHHVECTSLQTELHQLLSLSRV